MFEVCILLTTDSNHSVVLFHDMAFSSERKRDSSNQQASCRRTECHFPLSEFESTEWNAAESSAHRCIFCFDGINPAYHDGREDQWMLDYCMPDLSLGVAGRGYQTAGLYAK